jgi:predicted ATPase
LQAAAELLDGFEDGAYFVALATIDDPALVASAIADPLGVTEGADRTLVEAIEAYLRGKELLLVLDNFEQVVEASPLVGELLSSCPRLKVLATSRTALRLYGEQGYEVPSLEVPDPGRLLPIDKLNQYEAVRLFVERAQAAKVDFSITKENAPAVAEICARLDGLPLAIELAAARIKLLPPQAMLKRLGSRLKLLTGGARDLPTRQRTLRGTIEWSHDLLDKGERTLFARLAVFSGGRTLEAIAAVCDAEGDLPVDALDGVESLLEKSLLRQEEGPEGEPRFVMLETIHEFARERLQASGEAEEVRRLHAEHFLALAEEAEPKLTAPDQVAWLEQLEAEHDNMRAALAWLLEQEEANLALRLEGALWRFWYVHTHLTEGRRWLEEALAKNGRVSASVRAKALNGAGVLALTQCDNEQGYLPEVVVLGEGRHLDLLPSPAAGADLSLPLLEDVEPIAPLPLADDVGSCRDLLQSHEGGKIVDHAVRKTCEHGYLSEKDANSQRILHPPEPRQADDEEHYADEGEDHGGGTRTGEVYERSDHDRAHEHREDQGRLEGPEDAPQKLVRGAGLEHGGGGDVREDVAHAEGQYEHERQHAGGAEAEEDRHH